MTIVILNVSLAELYTSLQNLTTLALAIPEICLLPSELTRSSATAEGPRDALC